jgi:hypothetical protein
MVLIDGTSMQHMTNVLVKVKLDEKHSVTSGNARCTISNPKILTSTMTHQGAREVVTPNWHDVDCEQFFLKNSSSLHTLQQIKMNDKSLVKKI